ncbi:hypothetical protein D7Z26_11700 [Cohnella endophytica]|uniref:Uncharacterized protein n=1 Tax=Cohnella endophytica TaxID=2419778 RepID=A0A494Y0V1_9BACL|nr:hypothetical protein [Cohnella endophytica]RKP54047.1 hypothetical protein D7Z26_11700 [Cohnella endophytica]
MNQTITVNKKEIAVTFSNYFDSELGQFLFKHVMCDVYMPGNEVVPIDVEKEQIKRVIEGFKKRTELYDEIPKENIKGKSLYVINSRMRYDLDWMKGNKPPKPISLAEHEKRKADEARGIKPAPIVEPEEAPEPTARRPEQPKAPEYKDNRRKYLLSKGFKHNLATNNWEIKDIRFPDSKIDKSPSDEEFAEGMNRLLEASYQNHLKRKNKPAPKPSEDKA